MDNTLISRRKFLKTAGLTLGGAALVVAGGGCAPAAAQDDSGARTTTPKTEMETPSFSFGKENTMNKRILVTYATRTGSTVGVASTIGETLGKRGFCVDVKPIAENPSVDGYQAVLVGSAVNGAKWLPEAVAFVKANQQALVQVPVVVFCVHIMNLGEDENSKKNRLAYLDEVRALIKPANEAFFAGMGMKPDEQSGLVRWAYRTFKIGPEGDCRDWGKIRSWAEAVAV